jgi:hypothetical protein
MSGNAIYVNVPELAPTLVQRTNWTPRGQEQSYELAFDIAGAREVLPKAHFTNLIQHKFRFKGFESWSEFYAVIDPNAVVFHSDKSGSIYKYLRENLSGGVESRHASTFGQPALVKGYERQSGKSTCGSEGSVSPAQSNSGVGVTESRGAVEAERCQDQAEPCDSALPYTSGSSTVVSKTFIPPIQFVQDHSCTICGEWHGEEICPERVKSSDDLRTVIAQNSVIKNGLPAMSPPWENKEDTERDIKMLCDTLKLFCGAPVYKGRVREALREAKIIK